MPCDSPFILEHEEVKGTPVGCGRCPYCKRKRVNGWVARLLEEEKGKVSSYFITLTYDTDNVRMTDNGYMTLDKEDVQKFMKRLRKGNKRKLVYYLVGEYGERTKRPHIHMILFDLEDKEKLRKCWNKGDIHIGKVSGASIAYTAKYIDKDSRIPIHKYDDRLKEFSLMSKGIGKNYIENRQVKKYHKDDYRRLYYVTVEGYKVGLPRYWYKELYDDFEMAKQRGYLEEMEREKEKKMKLKYEKLYGKVKTYSFERYKADIKEGKFKQFNNRKNKRNV